jgi:hypothetical protein
MKLTSQLSRYNLDYNFYNDLFLNTDCSQHHDSCNCAWKHFQKAEYARSMVNFLESKKLALQDEYDIKKNYSNTNILTYALTIGSAEEIDIKPCLYLWNRFINSADGKKLYDVEKYFERGGNNKIHIHAIFKKDSKFSRSFNELRKRFGIYNKKQHNFDLKRLTGLAIPKWKNYIKKDSLNAWNKDANIILNKDS